MGSKVVTLEVKTFMDTFLECGPPDKVWRTPGTFFKILLFFPPRKKQKIFPNFEKCSWGCETPDKIFGLRVCDLSKSIKLFQEKLLPKKFFRPNAAQ